MRIITLILAALLLAAPAAAQPPAQPAARVHLPMLGQAPVIDPDHAVIAAAAQGLRYPSESDYPLEPFLHAGAESPAEVCALLAGRAGARYELRDLAALLARLATAPPDATPQEQAQAAGFAALRELMLARLAQPTVCRIGAIQVTVYLIGVSEQGHVIGLRTTAIET